MFNLKSLTDKLSFFKNSSLLLPIIIGAVGGLMFIPTQLLSSRLKGKVESQSIATGRKVKSEEPVAAEQWKTEQQRLAACENDANQIARRAQQTTQRELLSYKIFLEKDQSALIFREFGQQYRGGIEQILTRINARDCPTDAEIERALQQSPLASSRLDTTASSIRAPALYSRTSPHEGSYSGLNEEATIIDGLCRERAESASIYTNPAELSGYQFWGEYKYEGKKGVEDCWYYQLAYWVIEDVIDTIGAMNAGSNTVPTSPVKRLLAVRFTKGTAGYTPTARPTVSRMSTIRSGISTGLGAGLERTTQGDVPRYVLSIDTGLTEPCTGRFCNETIDVIHFNVAVVVGNKAVLPFMRELCTGKEHKSKGFTGVEPQQTFKHNQITILESSITPINREEETHSLYRYGDDAAVELDLICEYIFNKKGYDAIKPESVKTILTQALSTNQPGTALQ